jgi:hypothetical protein
MDTPAYSRVLPALALFFFAAFGVSPLATQIHIDRVCEERRSEDCNDSSVGAEASLLNLQCALAVIVPCK